MAWRTATVMEERAAFVRKRKSGLYLMAELCREFGISREVGYKWWRRYQESGLEGLRDQSRARKSQGARTPEHVVKALVRFRKRHPDFGPRKIVRILRRRRPEVAWPAASTAGEIFKRHGLVVPRATRRRQQPPGPPFVESTQPNEVWSADYKGEFRLGCGAYCYPLTVADHFSRFILGCDGKESTGYEGTKESFELLFAEYGLPQVILSDGGPPFASMGLSRLSRLSVWWIQLGIRPILIEPGKPQQNGRHERMHKDLKAATTRPPSRSFRGQQQRFSRFRKLYNELRPHDSLGGQCPADLYCPSDRTHTPGKTPVVEYPGHFEVRRILANGTFSWKGEKVFATSVLAGERVGLEEVDDGVWVLYFGPVPLGRFAERERLII